MRPLHGVVGLLIACSASPRSPAPVTGEAARPVDEDTHAFALGAEHGCARTHDGGVSCWGLNDEGQVGDGTREDRYTPVVLAGLTGVAGVTAGREHSCAWTTAGEAYCWGGHGSGPADTQLTPRVVTGLPEVVELVSGTTEVCARSRDGTVRCFGFWSWTAEARLPVEVTGAKGARSIAVGRFVACGILESGSVGCWEVGYGPETTAAAVRLVEGVAVDRLAAVGGGLAQDDFLGWSASGRYTAWKQVLAEPPVIVPAPVLPAASRLALGPTGGCAIIEVAVQCWPFDEGVHGTPVAIAGTAGARGVAVGGDWAASRPAFGCASFADGTLKCWGPASSLGAGVRDASAVPVEVNGIDDALELAASPEGGSACARRRSGAVACWGQMRETWGYGSEGVIHRAPFEVGIDDAVSLVAGVGGGCARRSSGGVTCFSDRASQDVAIQGTSLALAVSEACAIDARGAPVCVAEEPPADPTAIVEEDERTVPSGVGRLKKLWLGFDTGCAIQRSGKLACWYRDYQAPRELAVVAPAAVDVAIGDDASCFVRPDGTVGCAALEVPFGKVEDVPGITGAVAIAAGFGGFCALDRGGSVACWGEAFRHKGEPARDGTFTALATIEGLADATQIAGAEHQMCALRANNHVVCWGIRDYLGNDGTIEAGPVTVVGVAL